MIPLDNPSGCLALADAAPKLVSVVLTLEQHDYLLHLLQRLHQRSKDHAS